MLMQAIIIKLSGSYTNLKKIKVGGGIGRRAIIRGVRQAYRK